MKSFYLRSLIVVFLSSSVIAGAVSALSYNFTFKSSMMPMATVTGGGNYCQNETGVEVIFTGSGGTGTGFYTFNYEVGGVNGSISSNSGDDTASLPYDTSIIGTSIYRLLSVSFNGGPETTLSNQFEVFRTVTRPTAAFDFTDNQCSGASVSFTNNSTTGSGITYLWNFGDGETSTEFEPSHEFDARGCNTQSFNVSLQVSSNGCVVTERRSINILETPNLILTDVGNPLDPFNNCSGSSTSSSYTIMVDDDTTDTCVTNKRIDWGDGSAIENNPSFPLSHTYTTSGAFNLRFIGDSDNGCEAETDYVVANVSNPQGGLNSPGTTQNLCAPTDDLQFSISNWGGNSNDTQYTIDYGDGTPVVMYTQADLQASPAYNPSDPISSAPFPVPHIYTESNCPEEFYTVNLEIENACGSTAFTVSNITILSPPIALFDAPEETCVNTAVTFNNLSDSGFSRNCSTDALFEWDFGDGSPIENVGPGPVEDINHVYTVPGTYTVTLTAEGFCGEDVFQREICIEPELVPEISYSQVEGCTDFDVAVTNTTDTADICSELAYNWTVTYAADFCEAGPGDFSYVNGTDENSLEPEINFVQPGRYILSGTITGSSCGNVQIPEQEILVKQPPRAVIDPIDNLCEGDGLMISPTATVESCTVTSGTITYAWSFPGGSPATSSAVDPGTITYPSSGDYTVSLNVTNECGTTTATNVTFSISEDPVISGILTECEGETEQLTATGTGATGNPWRSLDSTIATVDASGLVTAVSPGTVDITFTNENRCEDTVSFEVRPGPTFTSQPLSDQEVCIGGSPTPLSVSFTNGSGTATYQWYENTVNSSTGGTAISGATSDTFTPDASSVGERFYYLIVNFTEGCPTIVSDVARVEVTPAPALTSQPQPTQDICVGAVISALQVQFDGGAGTPTYQWFSNNLNSSTGGIPITGANDSTYTPPVFSASGIFYFYVEVDFAASGCGSVTSDVAEINVTDDPVIDLQPLATQELCQGTMSTDLVVEASGGLGAFSYQWFENNVDSNTGGTAITGATTDTFTPPSNAVGTLYYYVVVDQTDLDCNVTSNTAEVIIVPAPSISNQPQSAEYCEGESINTMRVTPSNGSGAPSYQWFENNTDSNIGGTAITGATTDFYDPPATLGISYYYVEVSYATGGCSLVTSDVATIEVNQAPTIADESITVCSGNAFSYVPNNTGSNVVATNTTFSWSSPVISPAGSLTGGTSQSTSQSSLDQQLINTTNTSATATYTVTPNTGDCSGNSFELIVEVLPNPTVSFSESDQTICSGSTSIAVNLSSNFTSNISYEWNASIPAGISGAVTNGTDVIPDQTLINSTSVALTVTYSATATFENGSSSCEGVEQSYSITVLPELTASGVLSDYNGFGVSAAGVDDGSIDLTVSGGSGNYSFNWTGPGDYNASAEDISGLSAGNYQVTITDATCPALVLNFTVTSPPELLFSEDLAAHRDLECFGDNDGIIVVEITQESIGPYNYELVDESGATVFSNLNSNDLRQEFTGLTAQTYSVRITDGNSALKTLDGLEILQPSQIVITPSTTPISCFQANDASISLEVTGGSGNYSASWSNLATGFFQDNLAADIYTITVTDDNGCQEQISVEIEEAPEFFTSPTFSNISCFGANDGSIQLNLVGGVDPVTLTWSDGSTQGTTRNNLGPGTYTATITESSDRSCVITETFTITEPQEISLDSNVTNVLDCNQPNSGAIDLLVSGGSGPFTYSWSNGETTEDLSNITAGNYQVNVVDANGCTATREINVSGTTPIELDIIDQIDVNCDTGVISQILTAVVSGGVAPYNYRWSSGVVSGENGETTTTDLNGLVIVTVTDGLGCSREETFDVDLQPLGQAAFDTGSFAYSTFGDYSIQDPIQFTDLSTGSPISISWDFGDGTFSNETNPTHVYLSPGQYTVVQTVEYEYNCSQDFVITLNVTKGYKLVMPNAFTPNGDRINDVFKPVQEGLEDLKFEVYDTWGSTIYSEQGETIAGWNGVINDRNSENGNFYYKFSALTFYGTEVVSEGTFTKID
ncbi:gliding motility-associated C-terminal domain-containing protein [Nonlabens sp. Hel1_33_55]|uniref:PKD domain-containing protein n=1 Tax=Nonlabens sp. Hel1_33_55 TaxID=1336802 RepID=UPI000875CA01|nr:PKD domain-containing protein [Nonlabens sp. Hel1_33_55]SCX98270.1 gliding motility-associated C-terminal domain-containing protein [Nonlabens sp. Hel1_33_55]